MANSISSYPKYYLTENDKIFGLSDPYHLSYTRGGIDYPLDVLQFGVVKDKDSLWNPEDYNLKIQRTIKIDNADLLYGSNGIAYANAKIGIAIAWYSQSSSQRGVIDLGIISNIIDNQAFVLNYEFPKAGLRGKVFFKLFIYIKEGGIPEKSESFRINEQGFIVGELEYNSIILDGDGSIFPIYFTDLGNGPLWQVYCNVTDPYNQDFVDSIAIYVNENHRDACRLDRYGKDFDGVMLKEVLSSAMSVIVETVREDNPDFFNSLGTLPTTEGTVAQALKYFHSKSVSFDRPIEFAKTIRTYLDQKK